MRISSESPSPRGVLLCAGLDLRNALPTVVHGIDKPVICALNGGAASYGMDLALGCDIRIAAQRAKRMMRVGLAEPFDDHVHHVFLQLLPLFQSQDFREDMRSFLEKREPKFRGK